MPFDLEALKRPVGPFPLWVWPVGLLGGALAYRAFKPRAGGGGSGAFFPQPPGGAPSGGGSGGGTTPAVPSAVTHDAPATPPPDTSGAVASMLAALNTAIDRVTGLVQAIPLPGHVPTPSPQPSPVAPATIGPAPAASATPSAPGGGSSAPPVLNPVTVRPETVSAYAAAAPPGAPAFSTLSPSIQRAIDIATANARAAGTSVYGDGTTAIMRDAIARPSQLLTGPGVE